MGKFKIEGMMRSVYFNKKIKIKRQIKTHNTNYELKFKRKKIDAKLRSNIHIITIRHNNEIVFTRQSTIPAFSTQQKKTKQIMKNNINIIIITLIIIKVTISQLHI